MGETEAKSRRFRRLSDHARYPHRESGPSPGARVGADPGHSEECSFLLDIWRSRANGTEDRIFPNSPRRKACHPLTILVVVEFRHTKHQVARGTRPDAVVGDTAYLIKHVSHLRLTYQIRLLVFLAGERGTRLIIRVPSGCRTSEKLTSFLRANRRQVRMEKV